MAKDFAVGITIRAFDQTSGVVGNVNRSLGGLETRLKAANRMYQEQWQRTGMLAQQAGMAITGAGGAMAYGFKVAIDEASRYESTMKDVEIQSKASAGQMQSLTEIALSADMERLGKSGSAVAEMLRRLASEGYKVGAMKEMLVPITETSIALGYDEAETTKLMLNLMAQYKMEASDMPRIGDAMAAALANTSFQGSELAEAMKMAGVAGALMGWTLEETIAAVDRVAKTTGEASMAGRYLRAVLMEMKAPSDELADAFASVGIGAEEIAEAIKDPITLIELLTKAHERGMNFAQGFSNVSVAAAGALMGEAASVKAVEASLHDAGAAHDAATAKMQTMEGQQQQLAAQWDNIQRGIGEKLLPILKDLMDDLDPLLEAFKWLLGTDLGKPFVVAGAGLTAFMILLGPALVLINQAAQLYMFLQAQADLAAAAQAANGPAAAGASATVVTSTHAAAMGWARVAVAAEAANIAQTGAGRLGSGNLRLIGEAAVDATGNVRLLGSGVRDIVPASGEASTAIRGVGSTTASTTSGMIGGWMGVLAVLAAIGIKLMDIISYSRKAQDELDALYDIPEIANVVGAPESGKRDPTLDAQLEAEIETMHTAKERLAEIKSNIQKIRAFENKAASNYDWPRAREAAKMRRKYARETAEERRSLEDVVKKQELIIKDLRERGARAGEATAKGFADGMTGATPEITKAMDKAMGEAGKYLPHSDAEKGAFSRLTAAGNAVPQTLAEGIDQNSGEVARAMREALEKGMAEAQSALDGAKLDMPTPAPVGTGSAPATVERGSAAHAEAVARMVLEYRAQQEAKFGGPYKEAGGGFLGMLNALAVVGAKNKRSMPESIGHPRNNLQPGEQWTRYSDHRGVVVTDLPAPTPMYADGLSQALPPRPMYGAETQGMESRSAIPNLPNLMSEASRLGTTVQIFNFNAPVYGEEGIRQVAKVEIGKAAKQATYAR